MRGFFRIITIVVLLIGFCGLARPTFALVCCGTYTCTKYDANDNPIDDYTAQCGGAGCGGGCPSGYDMTDGCSMETSCGGGGSSCECGTNANGSCKSCGGNCGADYIYNCDGVVTPAITGYVEANVNAACKDSSGNVVVGSGQSLAGCAATVIDDQGNEVCRVVSIANHQCCASGSSYTCESVYATSTQTWTWQDGTVRCPSGWEELDRVWGIAPCVTRRNDDGEQELRCGTRLTCRSLTASQSCTCTACDSTAPTGLSIEQGASVTSANVSWTVGTGGATQRLYVDESQTEVNNGCTTPNACEVSATLDSGTNSYIVTGLEPETIYYFRVATYEDSSCTPSQVVSYTTPEVTLSGLVYLDTNNNCSTATPWNLGGLTVSVQGTGYEGSVGSDGRFGFFGGVDTPLNLVLDGYSADYIPSTATGCNAGSTLTSVTNPSTTNYFYLTPRREAWWQVVGGSVYSAGNVRSELPLVSANLIEPGAGGALGALMRGSGTVDVGPGAVSSAGYSAETRYRGKTMNYDYFAAHMGVTPSTQNYWGTNTITEPDVDQNTARDFYYLEPTGGNPAVVTGLTVSLGESYVIFVDGDLRIAGNVVVEQGGFLALMVNGSMYVSPAVTGVQGLYVVDGSLITETTGVVDDAANFEGSVVTWGGVNLGRDLSGGNAGSPAEVFSYRPDLLVNMPEAMKVFALRWEEVVPGTIR